MAVVKFVGAGVDMRDVNYGLPQMANDAKTMLTFKPVYAGYSFGNKGNLEISLYDALNHSMDFNYSITSVSSTAFRINAFGVKLSQTDGYNSYTGNFTATAKNVTGKITGYTYSNSKTGMKYVEITKMALQMDIANSDMDSSVANIFRGKDTIIGSDFSDYLAGFAGNDTIRAGLGDDSLEGGQGVPLCQDRCRVN